MKWFYFAYFLFATVMSAFLPWWSLFFIGIPAGFYLSVQHQKNVWSKGASLTAGSWLVLSLIPSAYYDFSLANRLSETFLIPHISLFFLLIGLVGALIGGSAFQLGFYVNCVIKKD